MKPIPAPRALDQYFLEARSKLLDLAAILDRIQRGDDGPLLKNDPRVANMQKALETLLGPAPNKAELIQQLFSLAYDPHWQKPQPR